LRQVVLTIKNRRKRCSVLVEEFRTIENNVVLDARLRAGLIANILQVKVMVGSQSKAGRIVRSQVNTGRAF